MWLSLAPKTAVIHSRATVNIVQINESLVTHPVSQVKARNNRAIGVKIKIQSTHLHALFLVLLTLSL